MKRQAVVLPVVVSLLALALVALTAAPALGKGGIPAPGAKVQLTATMSGNGLGSGLYKQEPLKRSLTVKAQGIALADNTVLTMSDNGVSLGTVTVLQGKIDFAISTCTRDVVPTMVAGDVLTATQADGSVVLSGTLH